MKRLLATLFVSLSLLTNMFVMGVSAEVEHWRINLFKPSASQTRDLTIRYGALSDNASDQITVSLFENDVFVATQTTTKAFGDTGVFARTVPAEGTYIYRLVASSSFYGDTKPAAETMTVTAPAAGPVTTVFVNNGRGTNTATANNTGAAAGGQGAGVQDGADQIVNGQDGQVAGAQTQGNENAGTQGQAGQTGEDGSSTNQPNQDILGAENQQPGTTSSNAWKWIAIVAGVSLLAFVYYRFVYRSSRAIGRR